ncbi:hypothetical protein [Nocardia sp. NPDC057668]|uniref:hypothetical protein n=1 Tax=Nocardia sp. NPDC057668 TaxID=3346202 RepID=UPI00366D9B30
MNKTSLNSGNLLPPAGTNKGSALASGNFLRVGDYFFKQGPLSGFYAVLQANGDLRFYFARPGATGGAYADIDPNQPYYSAVGDAGSAHIDPKWKFNPAQTNGQYFATIQNDGNFVIYRGTGPSDNKGPCWATNTWQRGPGPKYWAVFAPDGNLQIGSAPEGVVPDNGFDPAFITWNSSQSYAANRVTTGNTLQAGQWISRNTLLPSGNGKYGLTLTDTGALTLVCGTPPGSSIQTARQPYWSNRVTKPAFPCFAVMQTDGNLCVYKGTDPGHNQGLYWAISTKARPQGSYVTTITDDGTLAVYSGADPTTAAPSIWNNAAPANPTDAVLTIVSGNNQTVHGGGIGNDWTSAAPLSVKYGRANGVPFPGVQIYFAPYNPQGQAMRISFDGNSEQAYASYPTDNTGVATTPKVWVFILSTAGTTFDIRAAIGSYRGDPHIDFIIHGLDP